jgi:hypothetical protein
MVCTVPKIFAEPMPNLLLSLNKTTNRVFCKITKTNNDASALHNLLILLVNLHCHDQSLFTNINEFPN